MGETATFETTVQRTQPFTVAFQQMEGSYDDIPAALRRLFGWAEPRGHQITGMPMTVYLSGTEVPEAEAKYEVWLPIEDGATQFGPDESGLGIKPVDEMDVAVARHVGPYRTIGQTYRGMRSWMRDRGYTFGGPPMEAYLNGPADVASEDEYVTEIMIPVARV